MEMKTRMPEGLVLRPPTLEDAPGIVALIQAADVDAGADPDLSEADLLAEWSVPGFHLETDAWVVMDGGRIVGFEEFSNRWEHADLRGDGYVHPETRDRGVGTALLQALEARARSEIPLAPAGARVSLRNGLYGNDQPGRRLHENEGYQPVRYFWRMETGLATPPPPPQWPEEVELRLFSPVLDTRRLHAAAQEAFLDHWGNTPTDYETFRALRLEKEGFDPSLWFLAFAGEEIAGGALCQVQENKGHVDTLFVRRPWRRQGLGLALLYQAFGEFHRRGLEAVHLNVDAANLTGATRLYERAGMRITHEYVAYEKELRPAAPPEQERL